MLSLAFYAALSNPRSSASSNATVGGRTFDALVFGYYEGKKLLFAAKTRNGFTPAIRAELMRHFAGLETDVCPFADLPEK
jgi:hypothetical protein